MARKSRKKQEPTLFQGISKAVRLQGKVDRPLLIALFVLVAFGLVMVFSASMYDSVVSNNSGYALFVRQLLFVGVGLFAMWLLSLIDYRKFNNEKFCKALFLFTVVLLLMVFAPVIGVEVNGANRWIKIGIQFQPSEIAKGTGMIYMCMLATKHPEVLEMGTIRWEQKGLKEKLKGFAYYCIGPIFILCGITVIEPSFSAALAIGVAMLAVLFFAGVRFRKFLPYVPVVIIGIIILLIIEPWRIDRILDFGSGSQDYQITQSLLAIGSGGILGKGIGNGTQKLLFLPEMQNDFIFANVGEECGLWGCLLVLGLYAVIIYRGFKIASYCKNRFGSLYVSSVTALIAFQVFVNVGVAIGGLPVTGMALPFFSSGGSSVIILFAMMGPLLSVSRQTEIPRKEKERRTIDENPNGRRRNRRTHLSGTRHR